MLDAWFQKSVREISCSNFTQSLLWSNWHTVGTETMRERSADCCPLSFYQTSSSLSWSNRTVCPPSGHCNSKLDIFTSGFTWSGAQTCEGFILPSNEQHRASSSFLSSRSKSKCYPSGLKTCSKQGFLELCHSSGATALATSNCDAWGDSACCAAASWSCTLCF